MAKHDPHKQVKAIIDEDIHYCDSHKQLRSRLMATAPYEQSKLSLERSDGEVMANGVVIWNSDRTDYVVIWISPVVDIVPKGDPRDLLSNFIAECVEEHPHGRMRAAAMYEAFTRWAGPAAKEVTMTAFGRGMRARGLNRIATAKGRCYVGINIRGDLVRQGEQWTA